jgi:hypothetical protein
VKIAFSPRRKMVTGLLLAVVSAVVVIAGVPGRRNKVHVNSVCAAINEPQSTHGCRSSHSAVAKGPLVAPRKTTNCYL